MSGNINSARAKDGKGIGRKAERAMLANNRIIGQALKEGIDENSMRYGRILKVYGNGWWGVKLSDGRETKGTVRDLFASKKGTPIMVGGLVLLGLPDWEKEAATEKATGKKCQPRCYIEGILERKDANFLKKEGLIPEWMTEAEPDPMASNSAAAAPVGYEFVAEEDEDDEEEETKEEEAIPVSTVPRWTGKKNVRGAIKPNGDVDIDEI
jgi:hypothetical protein